MTALAPIFDARDRLRDRLTGWWGSLVTLIVLSPLALGYHVFELATGVNGATVQKALVVVFGILALLLLGVRRPPIAVMVIVGVFAVGWFIGGLVSARDQNLLDGVMVRGAAGYIFPWLAFLIDWRRITAAAHALAFTLIAPLALLAGGLGQVTGISDFLMFEYTGAIRLAGGMPPAYLAALSLFGVVGGLWLWTLGKPIGLLLALGNAAICAATGTRGATIAAGIVFLGMLVAAVVFRLRWWKASMVIGVIGLVGAVGVMLPTFIQRSSSSVYGIFGFSGRSAAWEYFLSRFWEHPWTGFGPGGATVLSQESGNKTIAKSFVSPHSAYVSLLVDLGIPLVVLLLSAFLVLFVVVGRTLPRAQRVLLVLVGVSCAFYGGFDNLLNAPQSAVPLGLLLAMMWGSAPTLELSERRRWRLQSRAGDLAAAGESESLPQADHA